MDDDSLSDDMKCQNCVTVGGTACILRPAYGQEECRSLSVLVVLMIASLMETLAPDASSNVP